ncbi:unnamed protein product [Boreogadus saida]
MSPVVSRQQSLDSNGEAAAACEPVGSHAPTPHCLFESEDSSLDSLLAGACLVVNPLSHPDLAEVLQGQLEDPGMDQKVIKLDDLAPAPGAGARQSGAQCPTSPQLQHGFVETAFPGPVGWSTSVWSSWRRTSLEDDPFLDMLG